MSRYEQTLENDNSSPNYEVGAEPEETSSPENREARTIKVREYMGNLALVGTAMVSGNFIGRELIERVSDMDPGQPSLPVYAALAASYAIGLTKMNR